MKALIKLAEDQQPNWWNETLRSKDLFVAVRDGYLNAYVNGQSVFRIEGERGPDGIRPRVAIHYKYLLKPSVAKGTEYVTFDGIRFLQKGQPLDPQSIVQTGYRPGETLTELIKAAKVYSNAEKQGVAEIIKKNLNVIDVEAAFAKPSDNGGRTTAPRLDIVALQKVDRETAALVFYEAKRASDTRLRSNGGEPEVVAQLKNYSRFLEDHSEQIVEAYRNACKALVDLRAPIQTIKTDDLIQGAACGKLRIKVDTKPRLVVFEFDAAQKGGDAFKKRHAALMEFGIVVRAKGNPKDFNLTRD